MKVVIVNRYYPPYQSATGYHANQLAKYLCAFFDVQIVTQKGHYNKHTVGEIKSFGKIKYVTSFFKSNWVYLRMLAAFVDSFFLIKAAKKINADYYIILTDPPFLNLFAATFLKDKRLALWLMDLYPEAFVSGGYVSKTNPFFKYFIKKLRSFRPDMLIALGAFQLSHFKKAINGTDAEAILPTGLISEISNKSESGPEWYNPEKIHYAYVGNVGEAHDIEALVAFADTMDSNKGTFVVSAYGQRSIALKRFLLNRPAVIILDYVAQTDLLWIDIQIVSLRSTWTNICVPSKGISALQMGQAIIFIGEENSDSWSYVREAGWRIDPKISKTEIAQILASITKKVLHDKKQKALLLAQELDSQRQEVYEQIKKQISGAKQ